MIAKLREVALWTGAALGVLCVAWAAGMWVFGVTPLVFTSGSMSPEINAGDLAFSRTVAAADLRVGDVVSVENAEDVRVTHRITLIEATDAGAALTLKGDTNDRPDAETYLVTSAERVGGVLPKVGYAISWVSSPIGMFAGGMFVMALLAVAFYRPSPRVNESDMQSGEIDGGGKAAVIVASVLILGLTSTLTPVQTTTAAFSDRATMTGTSNASALPPAPTDITCTNSSGIITPGAIIAWPAVPDQSGHKVYIDFRVFEDAALTQQIDGDELPAAPYRLAPGTTSWDRVRTPVGKAGDAWVRVRSVYLDSAGNNPTWYSANDRVYKVNRPTANIRTSCVAKVR